MGGGGGKGRRHFPGSFQRFFLSSAAAACELREDDESGKHFHRLSVISPLNMVTHDHEFTPSSGIHIPHTHTHTHTDTHTGKKGRDKRDLGWRFFSYNVLHLAYVLGMRMEKNVEWDAGISSLSPNPMQALFRCRGSSCARARACLPYMLSKYLLHDIGSEPRFSAFLG
jgi:hypothetical protein